MDILVEIQSNQAAKGVTAGYDALVDFLELIEHFLSRLNICAQVSPTPSMDEIMDKILMELFSTFALATKELKQGRSSECVLTDVLRHSSHRSQIYQERVRREGGRGCPREAGSTHAR